MEEFKLNEELTIIKQVKFENDYHVLLVEYLMNKSPYYVVGLFRDNYSPLIMEIYERIEMILTDKFCGEKLYNTLYEAEQRFKVELREAPDNIKENEEIDIAFKSISSNK